MTQDLRHPGADLVDRFPYRAVRDAYLDATASYWRRRAQRFEDARPRRDDFTGNATIQQLRDQWNRLTELADACRARAEMLDTSAAEYDQALHDLHDLEEVA